MRIKYDKVSDVLYISLSDEAVHESDENKSGVIIDYSTDGKIVGIEILSASKKMPNPLKVEYEVA